MLVKLEHANFHIGTQPLLEDATLQIDEKEKVCLVGRNGAGKSTLLRILAGQNKLDSGEHYQTAGLKIAYLSQEPPAARDQAIYDYVASGLGDICDLLIEYHHVSEQAAQDSNALERMLKIQETLDHQDGWRLQERVETVLNRLHLDGEQTMASLSGGWLRRVELARALVGEPHLLLLDEPTNHLDIEGIQWLEQFFAQYQGTIVFVSHDRAFIRKLADRIVDLDRGQISSWPGNYDTYLTKKAEQLEIEELHNKAFDKKLAQEEVWIRQGIKARRTRNEGRVRALKALRNERAQRVDRQGNASFTIAEAERSGKLVFEMHDAAFSFADKPIVRKLTTQVIKGERIALVGPNGCGKSTLLKLLLGELKPTSGTIRVGTKLEVAYFDQHRDALPKDASVIDAVADGKDTVTIGGQSRHVIGYLGDFLFAPDRVRQPVRVLSGGEKNRLLLAKMFLKPSNLLVLDEPTNDLDVETLELLEEQLSNFDGTVLLVSHDRAFIDNVATQCWRLSGDGNIELHVGGYSDLPPLKEVTKPALQPAVEKAITSEATNPVKPASAAKPKKLSYKLQLELDALPATIEALENEIDALQATIAQPEFFNQPIEQTTPTLERLAEAEQALEHAFERWQELDEMAAGH